MKNLKSHLHLKELSFDVILGWPEQERLQKQNVKLDIFVIYPKLPLACVTDELNDTFCYAELIEKIKNHVESKSFRLIEHLTHDVYHILKTSLPLDLNVKIQATKWPSISNLIGGVCFSCGDFE